MRTTVSNSLRISMVGMLVLILVSSGLSALSFQQMTTRITVVTHDVLPTFKRADRIKDLARTIERIAHRIPNTTGAFELETLMFQIRALTDTLHTAIDGLDGVLVEPEDKAATRQDLALVETAIGHLHSLMIAREAQHTTVRAAITALSKARGQLRRVAVAAFGPESALGSETAVPETRPTKAPEPPRMVDLLRIVDLADMALLDPNPARVVVYRQRFERTLNRLLADPSLPEPVAGGLITARDQLRPVFDARLSALRLTLRIRVAVDRLVALDRLIARVNALTDRIGDHTRIAIDRVERTAMTRAPVLLIAAFLSILLAIVALVYVNTRVVGRMRRVRAVMQDHVKGKRPPLAVGSRDEIADMAHSFRHFVEAVDEQTAEVQRQRDLIKAVLDSMTVGVAAFDKDLKLIAWNQQFLDIRDYPPELARDGTDYAAFMTHDVARQEFGVGDPAVILDKKVAEARHFTPHASERRRPDGTFIEMRRGPIDGGGFVSLFADITDRKTTEEALTLALETNRRQTERFRNLTANLPAMVVQFEMRDDGRPRILYASPDMRAVFGFSGDKLSDDTTRPFLERVYAHDRPALEAAFRDLLTTHEGLHQTFRVRDTDGHVRWLEAAARPYRPAEGRWLWDGVLLDITQRKLAEDALRRNEETLRAILDSSPVGASIVQPNGYMSFANAAMASLLGLSRADLMARPTSDHYQDAADEQGLLDRLRTGEAILNEEVTLRRQDGSPAHVLVTLIPAGEWGSHFGWVYDITERKAAEQAVRDKEERLRAILESSPVGATVVTLDGTLSFANTAAAAMLGLTQADLLAMEARAIYLTPEDRDVIAERLVRGETIRNEDVVLRHRDGRPVNALLTLVPTPDGEGYFGWIYDITERKMVEDEVKAKMEELEQFSRIAVGRELRMIGLKREINALSARLGEGTPYEIAE